MTLALLEVWHSRPIAPTRRISLGEIDLPTEPAPGFGPILLGGIAARFGDELDDDMTDELIVLVNLIRRGQRVSQPRMRHRLQQDRIGLTRSRHRLVRSSGKVRYQLQDDRGTGPQHILAAVYAAARLDHNGRDAALAAVETGLAWPGGADATLIAHLAGGSGIRLADGDPIEWAREILGYAELDNHDAPDVQRRFRDLLRDAHPDSGGATAGAADRISELAEARRILLA